LTHLIVNIEVKAVICDVVVAINLCNLNILSYVRLTKIWWELWVKCIVVAWWSKRVLRVLILLMEEVVPSLRMLWHMHLGWRRLCSQV